METFEIENAGHLKHHILEGFNDHNFLNVITNLLDGASFISCNSFLFSNKTDIKCQAQWIIYFELLEKLIFN